MNPATRPRTRRDDVRLLVLDPADDSVRDEPFAVFPELLAPGDLVVVNDAATLPSSLFAHTEAGQRLEMRLIGPGRGPAHFQAVLFGPGDYHTPTEHRASPPELQVGARLRVGDGLNAEVVARSPLSGRLLELAFDRSGAALWSALYAEGAPVQYAYVPEPLPLWEVQTVYASRPWAAEMPSAGRPLTWRALARLQARGVGLGWLTHAAGLSATGDPAIDGVLPLPERYELPAATVAQLQATRARGGRVLAVGTTVVRALEGNAAAHAGRLVAGPGETDLVLGPGHRLRWVDGILSGMHDPRESHYQLLSAFAPDALLRRGFEHAVAEGYLAHELGDSTLILPAQNSV